MSDPAGEHRGASQSPSGPPPDDGLWRSISPGVYQLNVSSLENLGELARSPNRVVILVDTMDAAEHGQSEFPDYAFVALPADCVSAKNVDLGPLANRQYSKRQSNCIQYQR